MPSRPRRRGAPTAATGSMRVSYPAGFEFEDSDPFAMTFPSGSRAEETRGRGSIGNKSLYSLSYVPYLVIYRFVVLFDAGKRKHC